MRVLLLHDYYQNRGGEDVAFEREADLLEATPGVHVVRFTRHNDAIKAMGLARRAALPLTNAWSRESARAVAQVVARERLDVAHAHNLWPLLSPSVLAALRRAGVPTVFTAHNYYLFCLNGIFFRDGRVCTDCVGRAPLPGVRHRCYRGVAGSASRALALVLHRRLRTFERVDRILTPTEFARGYFLRAGFSSQQVRAKALSVAEPTSPGGLLASRPFPHPARFLLASRLVPEKGGLVLVQALHTMRQPAELVIAGVGPFEPQLRAEVARLGLEQRVRFLGQLDAARLWKEMAGATATILPSLWFETFGFTAIESYAVGRPVVASAIGALAEVVVHERTGFTFPPGDVVALASRLDELAASPSLCERLGAAGRARYEELYTPARNRDRLLAIYHELIEERGRA